MTTPDVNALSALKFNWAVVPDDVWRPSSYYVEELHRETGRLLRGGLAEARESRDASPIGMVIQGQRGTGKTHFLGWARQEVQREEGYFFLVGLLDARNFWESIVVSMLDGLAREQDDGRTQLTVFLDRLSSLIAVSRMVRRSILGSSPLTREALDNFIKALRHHDRHIGHEVQHTARALVLLASSDLGLQDIGSTYLSSLADEDPGERAAWGIRQAPKSPQEIVKDLSRLLALTGPSVIAVDQIDTLLAQSTILTEAVQPADPAESLMVEQVAGGLMTLREVTRRTLLVVTCLPVAWMLIEKTATDSVPDRFRQAAQLMTIPDVQSAISLIERRFSARFQELGVTPPYPTWPVKPSAFAGAPGFTPRQLLIKIDAHIQACLAEGTVRELESLSDPTPAGGASPVFPARLPAGEGGGGSGSGAGTPSGTASFAATGAGGNLAAFRSWAESSRNGQEWVEAAHQGEGSDGGEPSGTGAQAVPTADLAAIDERFTKFRETADVLDALTPAGEDATMPGLLAAGLTAWIMEQGDAGRVFTQDPAPSAKPALHARLRRSLDEATEDEAHWAFRAISTDNANAALHRVRAACVTAGLNAGVSKRRLFLLRNAAWSHGPRTQEVIAAFEHSGGTVLPVAPSDLAVLAALRDLLADNPPGLAEWLAERRPTREVTLLREALREARIVPGEVYEDTPDITDTDDRERETRDAPVEEQDSPDGGGTPAPSYVPTAPAFVPSRPAAHATFPPTMPDTGITPSVTIGKTIIGDTSVTIELEALRKHVAIFAGSGSGKTVLIRRLIEECALHGVSAIVLDPNNDLARLGDPWPSAPPYWNAQDQAKAERYVAETDVVIWTPRRSAGRPLSFQPLPDFSGVVDDADEFNEAVEVAVASIVPRIKLDGRTAKAQWGQAVLREALRYCGLRGGTTLKGLVQVLAALPYGVSELGNAEKIGADLAQTLTAAMVNDPLFGGEGTPVDPAHLLTPPPGKKARVSVINLAGLPTDEQRQSFVNQLQMALFAWIKRHPAGHRPLGGLFVMDEAQTFAPSGAMTACTHSTLALASQARKYGLGLVFATQAPKGLHNRIPGNAATQFFGLLNSPIQINAAKEMARAKGGAVPHISRLAPGRFYSALEGNPFLQVQTPMCLTHHPQSPLTAEEVIDRARRTL
ncbi:protein of unknown function DUF87 [Sinosporangium album]|uniref:AAA+ ATPase domain-containing protein n=1 Tax=Sinosporangium album TaxID=504805 RepID=A0A1G7T4B1_9ACTN|nr:ATP-binding protein [Sinosporangium album]SDG29932.1 protein of unknown function DUF87 [Sinosporangium album]